MAALEENSAEILICAQEMEKILKKYIKVLHEIDKTVGVRTFDMRDQVSKQQFDRIKKIEQTLLAQIPQYQNFIEVLMGRGVAGRIYNALANRMG